MNNTIPRADAAEAKRRAEWLHKHKAHKDWIILSVSEVAVIRDELLILERERDEARERIEKQKLEINRLNGATNHAGGTPLKIALRKRDEAREALEEERKWHHRTHKELIEAQCKLLDIEYDKLKS